MGKLLFVNTNRVYGIFGLIVCAGLLVAGLWMTFSGTYAAIVLVPLAIYGGKVCLKLATQRVELYELGFTSRSALGTVSARYADLKSIARGAVRRNGVLTTLIHFTTIAGEKVTVSNEKFLKGDDKMGVLLECSCAALSEAWAKRLERQSEVVWLSNGSSPLLKIRKDGVLIAGKPGVEGFIPLAQFAAKPTHDLEVQLLNVTTKVMTVNSSEANYFVGWALLDRLAPKA